ncbi:ABC transporter H family member 2-like [Drosophila santomea]|uniref:ABC transporter H family member 2-like n=1 Tax=Drosophila santomea TaxID=129105 RepID=UPI001954D240|nr:ABC transporter H family member 2-like [Drosophila santomea]
MSNPTEGQEGRKPTSVLEAIKIVGAADKVLDLDESELNWDQIKRILVSHFRDKRSEQDLIMELTHIKEKNLEVEALYTKVMTLKKALVSLTQNRREQYTGVTIRIMGVPNIAKAYEIACREEKLTAIESVGSEPKTQRSLESRDKAIKETQKQDQEKEEPQTLEAHRETGIWSQYQWGGNNPPPFPMPFSMQSNFNQGDATGYQGPYRNYQNGNSRWNQNQASQGRQWNGYNSNRYNDNNYSNGNNNNGFNNSNYNNGYYNNGYNANNARGQLAIEPPTNREGSGQSRMSKNSNSSGQSRQSYNSNNSRRSFNSSGTADKNGSRASVSGQLHNIQENDGNFPQSASNKAQDI